MGSSASFASIDGRRVFICCPRIGAWHARAREFVSLSCTWWPRIPLPPSLAPVFGGSQWYLRPLLARGLLAAARGKVLPRKPALCCCFSCWLFSLLGLLFSFMEKYYIWNCFDFSLYCNPFLSDSNNVFIVSAIFWWWLQVLSGDVVGFVLICFPFIFKATLCDHLKRLGHLFVQFPTFCKYLSLVAIWFWSNVREPIPFSLIGSSTSSSFWIRRKKDHS
jgi:hypothetical protein